MNPSTAANTALRVFRVVAIAVIATLLIGFISQPAWSAGKRKTTKVTQQATLTSLPPIAQPGTTPAAPSNDNLVVAHFTPVIPGRAVVLQRQVGSKWRTASRGTQDRSGNVTFNVAAGTYRATAQATPSMPTATSGSVTTRVWNTVFEDTFEGTELNTNVWNYQKRERESVYSPRTCARADAGASSVSGGVLRLGVGIDPTMNGETCNYTSNGVAGTSPYLINTQIGTDKSFTAKYGIFSARMKVQRAKGMHSAFWMLPEGDKFVDGNPAAGTEIDVMEFFGETPSGKGNICSYVYYFTPGWKSVAEGGSFAGANAMIEGNWWDQYHVFSVEWTPSEYIFRVDGREYYRTSKSVSQANQYLLLSMLTSDYELANLTPDEYTQTADVDWVRVHEGVSDASLKKVVKRVVLKRSKK